MKYLAICLFSLFIFSCSSPSLYDKELLPEKIIVSEIRQAYSIVPLCYEMNEALIIYPGGLVKPDAYIPLAANIAEKLQIAVFIQKMPFNLAIFGSGRGRSLMKSYKYIDHWYIAGHSLGGVMAASYINENKNVFDGLIFLASYTMDKKSLAEVDIPVLSISGSEDGLVTREKIELSMDLLPESTIFAEIPGGNHAQFGSYGEQKGDNAAFISESEQHEKIVDLIQSFLEEISLQKAY